MTVLPPTASELAQPLDEISARLDPWPAVRRSLSRRGIPPRAAGGESPADLENRVGTGLMALYRDRRSPESFEALYHFSRPAVLAWIRSLLHPGLAHLDAVDLLQDTFVNVFRYPGGFRDRNDSSYRVWVRTIAGNIVRRSAGRSARHHMQELPDNWNEPQDNAADPYHQAESDEEREHLGRAWVLFLMMYGQAWSQLGERDRRTLHRVEVEGRSYQEVGEELKVGRSNLKMIVFRARKRIARRMREFFGGEERGAGTTPAKAATVRRKRKAEHSDAA